MALTKLESRVLLSIQKNGTFINLGNLEQDWPVCEGEAQDWLPPLRSLTDSAHILAFEMTFESGKTRLAPASVLDLKKNLVFKLSPSGESQLGEAKESALGEPKPTLVHNLKNGKWKVIR